MRRRKTIPVQQVRAWVNTCLAAPDLPRLGGRDLTPQQAFRLGAASLLERILHATGNYRGFGYHEFPGDETRRIYYGPARPLIDVLNESGQERPFMDPARK